MTGFFARMTTELLCFSASLLTYFAGVFTFPGSMARLAAVMRPTLQFLSANLPTSHIRKPALLVLKSPLTAHTSLFGQKRTFRTRSFISMAVVGNLRMTAVLRSFAIESALRGVSAAR